MFAYPILHRCVLIMLFTLVSACNGQHDSQDHVNKVRLVTLSPHLAELVVSAGALNNLVGVVSYSDFPEEVKSINIIGDAFKLNFETLLTLKPDYVLSWKDGTPISVIEKLKSLNINVVETSIKNLSDIPEVIQQIATLTNTQNIANKNIKLFNESLIELREKKNAKQTIFIETYHQPIYTISASHWMSKAAEICGYQNVFSDLSQISAAVDIESVIHKNPDAILTIAKKPDQQWQKWTNLSAVKNNKVFTIDPDYFSRPSMRILEGVQQLCSKQ